MRGRLEGSGSTPKQRPLENWLQELLIPPFPQTLEAITSCIFRIRCPPRAVEPRRAHRSAAADGGPSETPHTRQERSMLANTSLSSPRSRYFPHTPACPFPSQLQSLLAGCHPQHGSDACANLCGTARASSPPCWADSGRQALKISLAATPPPRQRQETAN